MPAVMLSSKTRAAIVLAAAATAAGCGGAARFQPGQWVTAKPSQKLAVLTLRVHGNGISVGDFNGEARGQVLVEIPLGWRVDVHCTNQATTFESCAIVANSLAATPAFPGAATPDPTKGLGPGASADFSFLASRPGVYRIASLVDDEEIGNATWDGFQVGGVSRPSARLLRSAL
jgi:Sulfocyanin (SoxE) domain